MSHIDIAKAAFGENINRFLSPNDPKQAVLWNLSKGLYELTLALDDIEPFVLQVREAVERRK